VADPWISYGWKIYVHYSKSEVKTIASGWRWKVLDKAKCGAISCALAFEAPVAAAACRFYICDSMKSIAGMFNYDAYINRCAEVGYWYSGAVVSWRSYTCLRRPFAP